jgi:uncharacterized phage protein (TIGR02218 family)
MAFSFPSDLEAHLITGTTTVCRCWVVTRKDGEVYGFTDHDTNLEFGDVTYRADTGMTASALEQSTGLSVDNTEALGVLSDASVTEEDVMAGKFDGARVQAWYVNWNALEQRVLQFNGTFGEITRSAGGFSAELRGLTEALNQPQGRIYQSNCSAVLGGTGCQFNLNQVGYSTEVAVETVEDQKVFTFENMVDFDDRWFEGGRLEVLSGTAKGQVVIIKNDRLSDANRIVELWQSLRLDIEVGDIIRLEAGCDRRSETCRLKFNNFNNFRGFPHMPGDDWLMSYPVSSGENEGGSLLGSGSDEDV